MPVPSSIIVCGHSLFITAVVASLRAREKLSVLHYSPHMPHLAAHLVALAPDLVIVEPGGVGAALCLHLLQAGISVLLLDPQHPRGQLLSSRPIMVSLTDHALYLMGSASL